MTDTTPRLVTPIHLKTRPGDALPSNEACYYLLTRDGLLIGRNQPFMRSLVPAPDFPRELEGQEPFLQLAYPKVPAHLLADIVGFFWAVAVKTGAEAAVLLGYDGRKIVPIVPEQTGTIGRGYSGRPYPIGLHYEIPVDLDGLRIIGDFHSHAFDPAYASSIDKADERYRPGLHVVAGRVDRDPPDWHVEYVVDGTRFSLAPESVLDLAAYPGRTMPANSEWMDRLQAMTPAEYNRR
jgi:hypothetical protein